MLKHDHGEGREVRACPYPGGVLTISELLVSHTVGSRDHNMFYPGEHSVTPSSSCDLTAEMYS